MKKIGFIDYFLDEWHANKYPEWIRQASNGEMNVAYAYALTDSPNGRTNAAWCADHGVELLGSIQEVVDRSDYLVVLSPDHPQFHEELAELPLRSGKPTYVDKTFAPSQAIAQRLFELAEKHGTPLFSSSALRYAAEYGKLDKTGIDMINSVGPGSFANYSIHQIEPIVSLLGSEAERVMFIGTERTPAWLIGFAGGRQAAIHHFAGAPFSLSVHYGAAGKSAAVRAESDFFGSFIADLVRFFESGEPAVDPAETIAIMTIIEHGIRAAAVPYQWIELPRGN
ncbi:Gfo/Idh/MocA family protein [Paenibacillus ginsengarvi]|uniref:Gfo/Idh/MocA-like oxidoreductase N-terminal domain-containing protein n=1 Tax=Paenibacillus ginsengarvi TaxID=400777 RepID=A0A3B0CIS5_9BACL|nr:Gfo/Idh/MocA family oxidoreductase [Paenibacillus ginsengarvi]RKN84900.1 hypothetical protein D7M11_10230 [Paenibacillus ginsengarvi]